MQQNNDVQLQEINLQSQKNKSDNDEEFYSIEPGGSQKKSQKSRASDVFHSVNNNSEDEQGFFDNLFNGVIQPQKIYQIQKIFNDIKIKLTTVQQDLKTEFYNMDKNIREKLQTQKDNLNLWIRKKVEEIVMNLLATLRPQLQEKLKDPYMCDCVKYFVDDCVDEVWPHIEEEVLEKLRLNIADPYSEKVNVKPKVCCLLIPWQYFKQWYLYTMYPFDRSIWQQIRTISWWLFIIIKCIPFYGIQAFFFCFIFFMIDKRDEYQLVEYILMFKKMQFISIGGFGGLFGYFIFYSCSTVSEITNPDYYHQCKEQGPAIFFEIWFDMFGFILQIAMVWLSFAILPCSKVKGKVKFVYARCSTIMDVETPQCCFCEFNVERGGRLKGFIIWDVFTFLICLLIFLFLAYGTGEKSDWQIRSTMYFVKTLYGVLSFPFMVFVIPFMTYLFTAAKKTGYDKYGNCVPKVDNLKQYHKLKKIKNEEEYDDNYAQQYEKRQTFINQSLYDENVIDDLLMHQEEEKDE